MRTASSLLVALLLSAPAFAQELQVEAPNQTLKVSSGGKPVGELALPMAPRQLLLRGSQAYLAMGPAGLWVIDLSHPDAPAVLARFAEGHDVTGVLPGTGNTILAVEASWSVVPYDVTNPAAPAMTSLGSFPSGSAPVVLTPSAPQAPAPVEKPKPTAPAVITGFVSRVVQGAVVFDKGTEDGLLVGAHVEIFAQTPIDRPNPTTGAIEHTPSNESMAVMAVKSAQDHGAVADLNRGDIVRVGDRFVVTNAPVTERLIWGKSPEYRQQVLLVLRPFLELNALGVGSISELRYSYHFEIPLTVELAVAPLGFELRGGSGTRAFPTQLGVTAYYDTDYFAVGLGIGTSFYADLPSTVAPFTPVVASQSIISRAALFLNARLGSVDGLSLEVRNSSVVREAFVGDPMTFHWGSTQVAGYIPLNRQLTLQLQGGGGDNGWAFGEAGIRTYFRGTGGAGTIIVPLCVGGGGFIGSNTITGSAGPLVSLGVELRL
jgi:hypothetical protein